MQKKTQHYIRIVLRVIVHTMAFILLAKGLKGLFLTPGYKDGLISPEDQNHLRVFWAIPILVSLSIQYCLYSLYNSRSTEKIENSRVILKAIAIWMGIAAIVRVISIVVLRDPLPRLVPIVVELIFFTLLLYLSKESYENKNAIA